MAKPNWKNRTLWTGDNLDILRGMNSESVDLIYLDPPFNSNQNFSAPIGSEAAGAAFKDTWTLSDIDEAWHGEIADKDPTLYAIIDTAGLSHGKSMKSYLIMMAVRLLEMQRASQADREPVSALRFDRRPLSQDDGRWNFWYSKLSECNYLEENDDPQRQQNMEPYFRYDSVLLKRQKHYLECPLFSSHGRTH